ncbi:Glycosyl hydrolase family 32, N-terminal [Dillenia turbinata]|uniref:beta-fructofuranosidase n=1 Tax=Dillenia turbinata TaxID=194707 RepID=A0AAN8ZFZ5_9MAGN
MADETGGEKKDVEPSHPIPCSIINTKQIFCIILIAHGTLLFPERNLFPIELVLQAPLMGRQLEYMDCFRSLSSKNLQKTKDSLIGGLIGCGHSQQPEPCESTNQGFVPRKPNNTVHSKTTPFMPKPRSRGVSAGVSEKAFLTVSDDDGGDAYPWNSVEMGWQRTAYHFQPEKNWMNGRQQTSLLGPLFHERWYHLFYQQNPDSAVWGNITWGHAVSADLVHWLYLPLAMQPDSWFDWNGVWTGSATLLPDGQIVILYTGDTDDHVQVQNLAYPANLSDPLLLDWVKYAGNPVMTPPKFIALKDFRDPTTAWLGPDGLWRVAFGSKINKTGIALVYTTTNFTTFELLDGFLHEVPTTGMWECVDFYPISTLGYEGLDTSANGPGIKHVLKASFDDDRHDYYAIGTYDLFNNTWTPDDPEEDVGFKLRVDYGKYYASKTFYDQNKGRRILWGWIGETDSEAADLQQGWASVQSIPRIVIYDNKTGTNIIQWPIVEIECLRLNSTEFEDVELEPGSVVELDIGKSTQLDIVAEFKIESEALEATLEADVSYNCSGSSGSAQRGSLGPFGLQVLANENLTEQTPFYFYIAKASEGTYTSFFCSDQTRYASC